jgi:hypothetical protein
MSTSGSGSVGWPVGVTLTDEVAGSLSRRVDGRSAVGANLVYEVDRPCKLLGVPDESNEGAG